MIGLPIVGCGSGKVKPMSVRKRRGSSHWWYDFTINGVRYRGPLPQARTKPEARELEHRKKLSIYEGNDISQKSTTFGQFVDEVFWPWALGAYNTAEKSYGCHVRTVKKYFGSMLISEITPAHIEAFKQERIDTPVKSGSRRAPATVNRDLRTLSRILSKARERWLIKVNPFTGVKLVKTDNRRERFLSYDEEDELIRYLKERHPGLLPMVIVAINTGMRRGELVRLRWTDVYRDRELLHVTKTKNGRDRWVPINSAAAEVLESQSRVATGERVFELDPDKVSSAFRMIARRLGLKNLRLHDLRHTFATRLGNANTDPFTMAEILGHSDLSQTKRYTHAFHQNKIKAVKAVERKPTGKAGVVVKSSVTKTAQFLPRMPQGAHLN